MSDVEDVRSKIDIVEYIGQVVKLKRVGRNFKGLCPFHAEKTPSFHVSPDRQVFHCFGCGKGGSVFDFVMEYEHIEFAEALEDLAKRVGITLTHRPTDTPEAELKKKLYEINHLASEYYHYILTKHALGQKAREYLKNRGVTEKIMTTFMLGYSPNSWEALYTFLLKKGYEEEDIERAGLIIRRQSASGAHERNYYDRFRGRVMFTLKDHKGNIVGFSGRVLDPTAKEAKYINSPETPVYSKSHVLYGLDVTKDALVKANTAVLMEGEFDVISAFQAGVPNVVAIKGSALTEGHIQLLKRYTERLIFALDSDFAGDAASRRGIELADKAGFDMRVVHLPHGKDPDELARQSAPLLKQAIADAVPVYDYFISSALTRFDVTTAFGKRKVAEELIVLLAKIENTVVQAHYIKILAQKLEVPESTLAEELTKTKARLLRGLSPTQSAAASSVVSTSRGEKFELYLLALLLQGDTRDLFEEIEDIDADELSHVAVGKVLQLLREYLRAHPEIFLVKDFADSVPQELAQVVDHACLWDLSSFVENPEGFASEWTKTMRELRAAQIRKQLRVISQELKALTDTDGSTVDLQKRLRALTDELKALEK